MRASQLLLGDVVSLCAQGLKEQEAKLLLTVTWVLPTEAVCLYYWTALLSVRFCLMVSNGLHVVTRGHQLYITSMLEQREHYM